MMFEEKSQITGEKSDGILMYTLFFSYKNI